MTEEWIEDKKRGQLASGMSLRSGSAGDGETARHGEDVLEYEPFIPGTAPDPPSSFMKPKKKEYIVKDPKMKIPCCKSNSPYMYMRTHKFIPTFST